MHDGRLLGVDCLYASAEERSNLALGRIGKQLLDEGRSSEEAVLRRLGVACLRLLILNVNSVTA